MITGVGTIIWETNATTGFSGVDSVMKMSRKMQVIACKSTLCYQSMYKLEADNSKNQILH